MIFSLIEKESAHPAEEPGKEKKIADPCVMVIFGATGDLTGRKLLPALYNLARTGLLPTSFACVGFARRDKSHDDFRQEMLDDINEFSRVKPVDNKIWGDFSQHLFYHRSEFDSDDGYEKLAQFLQQLDTQFGTKGNRVFYLSTPPSYFPMIIEKLCKHQLIYNAANVKEKWSRVIIEKPFGHDLQTAIQLQKEISKYLAEEQIFRIDHYLGKETVQNLLVFRFSNSIFESIWNNHYIDNVQITVAEEIGIGTRGHFFEEAGMLRDIVQNHMMQLLSHVAMEPPTSLNADAIRDEKVKVMESLRPFPKDQIKDFVIRGQYGPGVVEGKEVPGYRQEKDVDPNSAVETYMAMQLFIDNWRWAGVPFYLRAGKRLPKRTTEIAIVFKNAPGYLFQAKEKQHEPNSIVIRIQPDEGISLKMNCKIPGVSTMLQPVNMNFQYGSYFGATPPEAYERLICDIMAGDCTLFARADEVLASWRFLTPVLESWTKEKPKDFPNYASGTWGPKEAEQLLAKDNRHWGVNDEK